MNGSSSSGSIEKKLELSTAWLQAIEVFVSGGTRFSRSTAERYRGILRRFAVMACEIDPERYGKPQDLDLLLLEAYGNKLDEWSPKPRTRGVYISAVRSFIAWCRAHEIPMPEDWRVRAVLPRRVAKQDPPIVSPPSQDLAAVFDSLPSVSARNQAIWLLAAAAGLRSSEIGKIKIGDFGRGENGPILRVLGKGGAERVVPLVRELEDAVSEYLSERGAATATDFLFCPVDRAADHRGSVGLSRVSIYRTIVEISRQVGLDCNPRDLRHSFAVRFLGFGGNPSDLQTVMGHRSLGTTTQYLRALRIEEARETIEKQVAGLRTTVAELRQPEALAQDPSSEED